MLSQLDRVNEDGLYLEDEVHMECLEERLRELFEEDFERRNFTWMMNLFGEKGLPEVEAPDAESLVIIGKLMTARDARFAAFYEDHESLGDAYVTVARPINRQIVRRVLEEYKEK